MLSGRPEPRSGALAPVDVRGLTGKRRDDRILSVSSLRVARVASGLSQTELATRAGVTRQLVAAAEAGRNTPSVDAAIRISRVLGIPVEELFAPSSEPWISVLGDDVEEGALLVAARVGDRLAVAPLRDELARGTAWTAPDAVIEQGRPRLFAGSRPERLVVVGCDPALGIAEQLLSGSGGRGLLAVSASSENALAALSDSRCHAAVVHGPEGALPPVPPGVRRFHLASWRVGLASLRRVTLRGALTEMRPLVQRERGAASQQALERAARALGAPVPPGPVARGHLPAARLVEARGGVAVTYEPAAARFGLEFLPLETHEVEVWVGERFLDHPSMRTFGELLSGRALRDRLAAIGGYDLGSFGEERRAA